VISSEEPVPCVASPPKALPVISRT